MSTKLDSSKLHPKFAAALDGWRPTLEERFFKILERLGARS
jgi:hypothetical protein